MFKLKFATRTIIQRGVIYLFILAIIIALYLAGSTLLDHLFESISGITSIISAGMTMIFGVFCMRRLRDYLTKATDPFFFKDKYDYGDALHALSKTLHTNVNQTDIIQASSDLLKTIFKTNDVDFRLIQENEESPFRSHQYIFSIPIIFENKKIGILELGPKRSGDEYKEIDMQLLATFAYQAAIALEKGRLYEKTEEYNLHLETVVRERTREIQSLQEDQKQAMIDISHNLETPLAIIKSELELLSESPVDKEKLDTIKKALIRVSQFIRQLLRLAKLNHSRDGVDLSPINLTSLVRGQIDYFEVMTGEKNIQIIPFIPSKKVGIMGNKRLIEELLANLVANAINYRRTGIESHIIISLIETENTVGITIEDNGIGISSTDLPEIFTRFYTGSQRTHTNSTGLGLAICKKIAEKHGGTISVTSTAGERTVFVVTFPKAKIKKPEKK